MLVKNFAEIVPTSLSNNKIEFPPDFISLFFGYLNIVALIFWHDWWDFFVCHFYFSDSIFQRLPKKFMLSTILALLMSATRNRSMVMAIIVSQQAITDATFVKLLEVLTKYHPVISLASFEASYLRCQSQFSLLSTIWISKAPLMLGGSIHPSHFSKACASQT